ncbi:hypothetical protein B296_00047156 [Ensete ventricosum]|uniref:Uncharacterized protein n=1 Tax=Ensete ventricosum TaxID=4639 RepID=A0A426Z0W5_ENSVE|nr:hypothetical protein B296_00047156 [Ensete ventricosum]
MQATVGLARGRCHFPLVGIVPIDDASAGAASTGMRLPTGVVPRVGPPTSGMGANGCCCGCARPLAHRRLHLRGHLVASYHYCSWPPLLAVALATGDCPSRPGRPCKGLGC